MGTQADIHSAPFQQGVKGFWDITPSFLISGRKGHNNDKFGEAMLLCKRASFHQTYHRLPNSLRHVLRSPPNATRTRKNESWPTLIHVDKKKKKPTLKTEYAPLEASLPESKNKNKTVFSGFCGSLKVSPSGPGASGYDPGALWVICPHRWWAEASFQRAACFFMFMATAKHPTPGDRLKGSGDHVLVQLTHRLPRSTSVLRRGWGHLSSERMIMKCVCFLSLPPSLWCPNPRVAMDIWRQQL